MIIYHLADVVALIHAAYIAFVVLGFILIIVGVAMDWRWVRNPYLRAVHLAAILLVCLEALIGAPCPMTILEDWLRGFGADQRDPGSFVGHLLDKLIFYDIPQWVFTEVYLAFGALVLLTFVVAPPRVAQSRRVPSN
jgi:hypothetical protein